MMLFRRSFGKNLRFGLKVCSVAKLSCSKQSLNPTPNIHSQNIFKYFLKKKKWKNLIQSQMCISKHLPFIFYENKKVFLAVGDL